MKKNFFKKLSFVLALAMMISTIAPAAGAFAAAKPVLNSTKQYLYLSELDGKTEYDFNIKNKVAGSTIACSSSNEAVATVESNGLTTAVGVGSAKVSVVITKNKKVVKTLKADVIVRDNIATVTAITNAPVAAIAVNETVDLGRTFTTNSGSSTATSSKTYWTVDKTTATIDAKGVFTATEAGEYKVTASVFQSAARHEAYLADSTKNAAYLLASKEVTIKVAATMTVAQTDLDTIKLTFDSAMTDVAKNLTLFALVGTTEVAVTTVKAVTPSTDKKTATVDLYVNFTEGTTYRVKYTDVKSVDFTAAKADYDKVSKIVITTTTAVVNDPTAIVVQLLDVNGVDISAKTGLKDRVSFTSSSNKVFYDTASKKIVFFAKDDTTNVEATFHTYKWDTTGKEIGNLTATGTIVGVTANALSVGAVKAWTILGVSDTPNYADVKQKVAVKETKRLFVQLNTMTGTTAGTTDSVADASKFKFESSDNTVLFVFANGTLNPIKAGTVTIVVKYNDIAVDTIILTVSAERKATDLQLDKTELSLSNSTNVNDNATVTVKVKDQLGDDFATSSLAVELLAGYPGTKTEIATVSGVSTIRVNGVVGGVKAPAGVYTYKVTANGLTRYFSVTIVEPTSPTAVVHQLTLSTNDADSVSSTTTPLPFVTIDLFGYAGAKTSHPGVTGSAFTVTVTKPDGTSSVIKSTNYALQTVSGAAITKIANGTYTVTAKNASNVAVDVKYFTVKDTQLKPVLAEVKAQTYATVADLNAIAIACFKVTFDGAEKTDFVMGETIGDVNTALYVKNVKWTQTIGSYTIVHTVDVNQYVYKTN